MATARLLSMYQISILPGEESELKPHRAASFRPLTTVHPGVNHVDLVDYPSVVASNPTLNQARYI